MIHFKAKKSLAATFALAVLNACGQGDSPKPFLLKDSRQESEELKRLRDLQMVHLIDADGSGASKELPAGDLVYYGTYYACRQPRPGIVGPPCENSLGGVLENLCRASYAEQVAIGEGALPQVDVPDVGSDNVPITHMWSIPPQSSNARMDLLVTAKEVYEYAVGLLQIALEEDECTSEVLLRRSSYVPLPTADEIDHPQPEHTIGGLYSAAIAQAWTSLIRLSNELAQLGAAVGDAQRGGAPTYAIGTDRALVGMQLSRAAVAHQLIQTAAGVTNSTEPYQYFGENGVAGSTRAPCRQSGLNKNALQALALLRTTGVAPQDVLAMPDFQARLTQDTYGQLLPGATVRNITTKYILDGESARTGNDSDTIAGPTVIARLKNDSRRTDIVSVTDETGLTLADFEKARVALAEELLAFGRLGTDLVSDPTASADLQPFAATRAEPEAMPAEYYSALIRTPVNCINCNLDAIPLVTEPLVELDADSAEYGERRNMAGGPFAGYDHSILRQLTKLRWLVQRVSVGEQTEYNKFGNYADVSVQQIMAPALSLVLADRIITGTLSLISNSGKSAYFDLEGYSSSDRPLVVKSEYGLLCATRGSVYGDTNCDLTTSKVASDFAFNSDHGRSVSTGFFDQGVYSTGVTLPDTLERWYLVVPKDNSKTTLGRGDYKPLIGFVPNTIGLGSDQRQWWPISPELEKLAGELIEPQPGDCSQPAVSCAGIRYDSRIALEDELSSDGSDIESSWRTYLQRARDAAELSDQLTNEYIAAGLQEDEWTVSDEDRQHAREQSAIAELDKLQSICGTAIDPETILGALRGGDGVVDLAAINQGPCDNGQTGTNADCVADQLITNWESALAANNAAKPLADCLASLSKRVAIVTLGSGLPCAWRDANGAVCGGSSTSKPCPVFAGKVDCSDKNNLLPANATWLLDAHDRASLGLFASDQTVNSGTSGGGEVCERIRRARDNPSEFANAPNLIQSESFSLPNLSLIRKRIALSPELGGYFTLYLDEKPAGTTGTSLGGPETRLWPCGPEGRPSDCPIPCTSPDIPNDPEGCSNVSYNQSYHCAYSDCTNQSDRALANRRMLDAFTAIQTSTWRAGEPDDGTPQHPGWGASIPVPCWEETTYAVGVPRSTISMKDASNVLRSVDGYYSTDRKMYDIPNSLVPFVMKMGYSDDAYFDNSGTYKGNVSNQFFTIQPFLILTSANEHNRESNLGDYAKTVWSGMAANDTSTDGFLYKYLTGAGESAALPSRSMSACRVNAPFTIYGYLKGFSAPKQQALLDGLELLCDASTGDFVLGGSCLSYAEVDGKVSNVNDLESLSGYLKCAANQISTNTAAAAFLDFPEAALDPLEKSSTGTYSTESGEIGQAYSELRQAAAQVALSGPILAGAIRGFGIDLALLKEEFKLYGIQDQIAQVKAESDMASAAIACASGLMGAVATLGAGTGAAVSSCGGMATTEYFGQKLLQLSDQATAIQREMAVTRYQQTFSGYVTTLQTEEVKLRQALETIRARLGKIESLKEEAARRLTAAVWDLSKQSTLVAGVATVLGKKRTTAQERYRSAYDNAVRLAFMSKRAIEQRLGMGLASMTEDLPLVDAPARWESSICASSPVDYNALKEQDGSKISYANTYIGDYVTKLGNVVDSYRQRYPFHEGADVLVASLRDDVMGAKSPCSVKSRNLLLSASRVDRYGVEGSQELAGWAAFGCNTTSSVDASGTTIETPNKDCVTVAHSPGAGLAEAAPYLVSFNNNGVCTGGDCGWNANVIFGQRIYLAPGKYVFSYFTTDDQPLAFTLRGTQGTYLEPNPHSKVQNDFRYRWYPFEVIEAGEFIAGFTKPDTGTSPWQGVVAAPMLEQDTVLSDAIAVPGVFQDADALGNAIANTCADMDGSTFRATRWRRGCDFLCSNGLGLTCANGKGTQACYWEASFSVRQRDLEAYTAFKQSGFARGNFNYRIQSLGLNFVGTGLQGCDGSSQACYGNGFVPYTIIHEGPYYVRNHSGEDFEAKLFTGRIEHARGLGAERYITNPISSTDMSLIESYMRREFSGRPLDGTFIVRVWDENNIKFDAIKDVQLVMKYRYWTRFQ